MCTYIYIAVCTLSHAHSVFVLNYLRSFLAMNYTLIVMWHQDIVPHSFWEASKDSGEKEVLMLSSMAAASEYQCVQGKQR